MLDRLAAMVIWMAVPDASIEHPLSADEQLALKTQVDQLGKERDQYKKRRATRVP